MRHPLSAFLAPLDWRQHEQKQPQQKPPQPPSSHHNSHIRNHNYHQKHSHNQHNYLHQFKSERVSLAAGRCYFSGFRNNNNNQKALISRHLVDQLVPKKPLTLRAALILYSVCLFTLVSLSTTSQLLSATKIAGQQQQTATKTTTAEQTNCHDQFSQKSQRQSNTNEAQQQQQQQRAAIRLQQQQPDDSPPAFYKPQTSQAQLTRDNGRQEESGSGENAAEQCADCLAIPLVALMGGRQLNGFLVQQLKRRRPSQLAPFLASFSSAAQSQPIARTVLGDYAAPAGDSDQSLQEPLGETKSSTSQQRAPSFGGYNRKSPIEAPSRPQQQHRAATKVASAGKPTLAPRSDEKCPMTGVLTICDQIDSYPTDEILHKLEVAKKSLKQTYFNLDSLFSDERDHSSEPFDSLSPRSPHSASLQPAQDGSSDKETDVDVVVTGRKDSLGKTTPATTPEFYYNDAGFDNAANNAGFSTDEDIQPQQQQQTANSSFGDLYAPSGRENELELGLAQRRTRGTKTSATIATTATLVESYKLPERAASSGAATFQKRARAHSANNQPAQLDSQTLEFGGRKQATVLPSLAPPPPSASGYQYHQLGLFNHNNQQQEPMISTFGSPFDDFVDIVERRAISITGRASSSADGAAASAASASLAAAGRYKAAPVESASGGEGRDKYPSSAHHGNEQPQPQPQQQQHRRQQPMFFSASSSPPPLSSQNSTSSSLARRLLALSRAPGQQHSEQLGLSGGGLKAAYESNQVFVANSRAQQGLQESADNSLAATTGIAISIGGGSQLLDPLQTAASNKASGANFRFVKAASSSPLPNVAPAARSSGAGSSALRLSRSRRQVSSTVRVSSIGGGFGTNSNARTTTTTSTTTATAASSADDGNFAAAARSRNTSERPANGNSASAGPADALPSISGDNNGGSADQSQPEPVCRAKSIYISPRAALNDKKQWKYVVNAPERDPQIRQIIRVDICQDPFGPCSDQVSLPFGFTSQCKQKYSKKKLLALDSQSGLLEVDTFFIPSCCVCQLVRNRDDSLEGDSSASQGGNGDAGSNEMVVAATTIVAAEMAREAAENGAGGGQPTRLAAATTTTTTTNGVRITSSRAASEKEEAEMEMEDLVELGGTSSSGSPQADSASSGDDAFEPELEFANSVASSPLAGEETGTSVAAGDSSNGERASGPNSDHREH